MSKIQKDKDTCFNAGVCLGAVIVFIIAMCFFAYTHKDTKDEKISAFYQGRNSYATYIYEVQQCVSKNYSMEHRLNKSKVAQSDGWRIEWHTDVPLRINFGPTDWFDCAKIKESEYQF